MHFIKTRSPTPTRQTPVLPPELWLLIAHHLPYEELESLFTLNRVFYAAVMDIRYHDINLLEADACRFLRKIDALRWVHFVAWVNSIGGPSQSLEALAILLVECHTRKVGRTETSSRPNKALDI
ncbi:hypothetical protein H0H81_012128 [Sphagnurus paluster]|uniref:F-box domain-containing protein n=1 Tax=Sphagnurus paluster TaxID=117069 RepID=A0A9P7KKC4_9AGAR|nr:hypothetical protein H0H81_012128 [Sphagnurus paluster]